MNIEETIKEMKARYGKTNELSVKDKHFIESYYERVLNKEFTRRGCGQCYQDAFIEMYYEIKTNGLRDMAEYILKRQVVRTINGIVYSRVNMTDEVAIKLLKDYPQRIVDFEQYPNDWDKLVDNQELETKGKKGKKEKSTVNPLVDNQELETKGKKEDTND